LGKLKKAGCKIKRDISKRSNAYKMLQNEEKIVIASNRVPYNITKKNGQIKYKKSVGGLVTALDPILSKNGGLWIGWSGYIGYDKDLRDKVTVTDDTQNGNYSLKFVSFSEKEIREYYHGFSNRILWPVFHSFISHSYFNNNYWKSYKHVNKKFSESILEEISGNELVWVQDYHLTLVPEMLRKKMRSLKILFFLHIPFPNYEIFRVLPWKKEILEGLLGCDLIGFQTPRDAINFLESCKEIIKTEIDFENKKIHLKDRIVEVKGLPISIDFNKFNELANNNESEKYIKSLKKLGKDIKIVLSVERLDYTKGIKERLLGINRFFEKYPKNKGKVIFLQISTPSRTKIREYISLKKEIDELVGQMNGRFGEELWSPINYLYKAHPQSKLAALYKISDICLITPLRDGMNLVAKEYVSCNTENNGVLILSEFAGAAVELKKYSITVNPYDIEDIADSINKALNMTINTKRMFMSNLIKIVQKNDIYAWANNFLKYKLST
jgi:alpha,alpha-trehalose-phosphate synthase [UDP-forming]